jgi:hypothetical protein
MCGTPFVTVGPTKAAGASCLEANLWWFRALRALPGPLLQERVEALMDDKRRMEDDMALRAKHIEVDADAELEDVSYCCAGHVPEPDCGLA